MPTLTRWFIKSALVYFVLALAIFALLAWGQTVTLPSYIAGLSPVSFHLLMVGWASQLIFGVVYWMFPRLSKARPRGNEHLAWFVYAALNAGLLLRLFVEPILALNPTRLLGWLLVLSAVLQVAAGWVFVWIAWGRVKPLGATREK